MRKVSVICIAVFTAAALLAGCQSTPEKPVVVQKDMEQLIEKANKPEKTQKDSSLKEVLKAPDEYKADFSGYNGDLIVQAHAKVIVPDARAVSTMRIGKRFFTQEEADRMINILLRGETLYKVDQRLTKEEVNEKLVTYYGMRDGTVPVNMDGENPEDKEKLQQVIEYYEDMLASAPDSIVPEPADTRFHTPEEAINPNAQVIEGMAAVNNKVAYLYINNGFFNENNIEAIFVNAKSKLEGNYRSAQYKVLNDEDLKGVQVPDTFALNEKEAQSAAEDVIKQLGIQGMTCVDIRYAVLSEDIAGGNTVADADAGRAYMSPEKLERGKWAYSLRYQREVNGIPVTITAHSGNGLEDEGDVSVPWPYERLEMIIDETGIVYFQYLSPYEEKDIVAEDSALKDFEEIASVFEKMFPITYGYINDEETDYKLQVNITEMRLGLMRITEQNSRDTGLLIPVWDFFGDLKSIPQTGEPHTNTGESLLTINAIDGSIIDRSLGY